MKDKVKLLEEQIDSINNNNEECKQLKQEMKLLKNSLSRKDEMIIEKKNKIKELTNVSKSNILIYKIFLIHNHSK